MGAEKRENLTTIRSRVSMVAFLTSCGITQANIARMMGVSRQRVGQLADKASDMGLNVVRRQIRHKKCLGCGNIVQKGRKFCSKECRPVKKFGGVSSHIEVEILVCDGCGVKFSRTRSLLYIAKKTAEYRGKTFKRKFCTRECYHKNGNGKS